MAWSENGVRMFEMQECPGDDRKAVRVHTIGLVRGDGRRSWVTSALKVLYCRTFVRYLEVFGGIGC